MMPPLSELSLPMMAFCTVFDSVSRTTKSNGLSCARTRLPKREYKDEEQIHEDGRRIFSTTETDEVGRAEPHQVLDEGVPVEEYTQDLRIKQTSSLSVLDESTGTARGACYRCGLTCGGARPPF